MDISSLKKKRAVHGQFEGKFLVAMPGMASDEFAGSVVYLCAHSEDGAMGFLVNRTSSITLAELIGQTELGERDDIRLAPQVYEASAVRHGGPVDSHRGFVLHSDDYCSDSTIPISPTVYLTSTIQILKAIANGRGPNRMAVALGYSGWGPGQLEREIAENSWLTFDSDADFVFDTDHDTKHARMMQRMGINEANFIAEAGNA